MGSEYTTNYRNVATGKNEIDVDSATKGFITSHQTTFNTSMRNVEETVKKLEESMPKDDISELSGADIGTKEYNAYSNLIDEVGNINSTERINFRLMGYRFIGYLALFLSVIIKIWSIQFDATYHIPTIVEDVGDAWLIIGSTLLAFVILFLSHGSADGFVNNKWFIKNRMILAGLFLFGTLSSLFFDYRAISNYTTKITDVRKEKNLGSDFSQMGIAMQNQESKAHSLSLQEQGVLDTLSKIRDRLQKIGDEREKINSEISSIKSQKDRTTSRSRIKTLNSNIYTSRKQLASLQTEEDRLLIRENKYNKELDSISLKKAEISSAKVAVVSVADIQAEQEKKIRLILMYVVIILIEVASFGGILADHMSNKNLEQDAREKASRIQKNNDMVVVLNRQLDAMMAKQIKRSGQSVALTGHIMDTFGATGVLQQASTAKMIGTTAGAILNANETALKGQEALIEAQVLQLDAGLIKQRNSKLEEYVVKLIEEEGRKNG